MVQVSGLRVQGSGFRDKGLGFRVQGPAFMVYGLGLRVSCVWGGAHLDFVLEAVGCPNHPVLHMHLPNTRRGRVSYRSTSLIRNNPLLGPFSRPMPRTLRWS